MSPEFLTKELKDRYGIYDKGQSVTIKVTRNLDHLHGTVHGVEYFLQEFWEEWNNRKVTTK